MKIAILVAGTSKYFPLFIDKPKCLYHLDGMIQLQRVIEDARTVVEDKDIIVVGGYKHECIATFLKQYPDIVFKVNERYMEPAIYSFRKAIEDVDDDVVFMFGDESISRKNIRLIAGSDRKLSILCHDKGYYYSLGIFKLRHDVLDIINDDKYLSMDAMKEIYCFANQKKEYDGTFDINSGICIGYTMIDFVRRIGEIEKIENPAITYAGEDIDFFHYDIDKEYIPDLDYFSDTDEYKNSMMLRIYSDYISENVRRIRSLPQKIRRIIAKWNH